MKAGHVIAGLAASAGLFGAGVYLARASSTTEPPAIAAAPAPVRVAARAQSAIHRAEPTPGLAIDLHDRDPKVRRAATAELARDPASDPRALLAASHDPDLEVSVVATIGLGKLYASGELPAAELVDRIRDRALPEKVRASALNGLGVVVAPENGRLLAELLASGDLLDRRSSAALLANQAAEIAVPALIAALGDADEYVRGNALEGLRRFSRGRDYGTDANAWRSWWQSRIVTP